MDSSRTQTRSAWQGLGGRLAPELRPARLLPNLAGGLIAALISVSIATAFAALIFSGELAAYLPAGVGLMLVGTILAGSLTALAGSFPPLVAGLQDSTAAVLSLVTLGVLNAMPPGAGPEAKFATVVAAIGLSALLTGVVFLLLGGFRLGDLVRYIPYPVVGGFLAGTGLLLVLGALSVSLDRPVLLWDVPALFAPGQAGRWLPGLLYAILLLGMLRRFSHPLLMPGLLVAGILATYAGLWATGTSIDQAIQGGWLLGSFAGQGGGLWQPLGPAGFASIDWGVLLGQTGNLSVVAVVSVIGLLLNASGLELATGQEVDLNRELKASGLANLAAGLAGAMGSFHTLSDSALVYRMGARSRLVGLTIAGLCLLVLLAGGAALAIFPKPVLGGLLLFMGLDFLVTWVWEGWFKLSRFDYLTVILILVTINVLGLLQGVGLGLAICVVQFVVAYGHTDVVRHTFTGSSFHSLVERSTQHQRLLRERADWLYILELQGFLFFGTASQLLRQVKARLAGAAGHLAQPRFIVLDFCHVSGVDSSAALVFTRLRQLTEARGIGLLFTRLSPEIERRLRREVLCDGDSGRWRIDADLDHGVEWCEERILADWEAARAGDQTGPEEAVAWGSAHLGEYLVRRELQAGEHLIEQGAPPQGLYFVEAGQLTVQLEGGGQSLRIRTIGPGTIVGEIGLYLGSPTTAAVVAGQPSTVYMLSSEELMRMERDDPATAAAFHKSIAQVLCERVLTTTGILESFIVP